MQGNKKNNNWRDNNVFKEVRDEGQKCFPTRWVCTLKEAPTGPVSKTQLVAQSFEELEVSELQKDSPTCATESLWLLVTMISQRQRTPVDLNSAFLQGMQLSCDILISGHHLTLRAEGHYGMSSSVFIVLLMLPYTGRT